jgi:hypothetical protein
MSSLLEDVEKMMMKSADSVKWWIGGVLVIILVAIVSILILDGMRYAGIPLFSVGNLSSGLIAAGNFVLGIIGAGTFTIGVLSVGTFSVGIFSVGVFSVGIFSIGVFSIGVFSIGFYALGIYFVKMFMECRPRRESEKNP